VSLMKGIIDPGEFFGTFLSSQKGLLKFLFPTVVIVVHLPESDLCMNCIEDSKKQALASIASKANK